MNRKWYYLTILLLISGAAVFSEESPRDDKNNILFTEIPQNPIQKWSQYGNLSAFFKNSGEKSGFFYDKNGNPLINSEPERRLIFIDSEGRITVLDDKYDYEHTNAPNDIWILLNGGVYFIHTSLKISNKNDDRKYIYYLSPDRKKLIQLSVDMVNPVSLAGDPNSKYLFISESDGVTIYMFTINADGTLSDKKLFDPDDCGC